MIKLINMIKNGSCCTPLRQWGEEMDEMMQLLSTHLFHCPIWYSTYQIDISSNALPDHQQLEYIAVLVVNYGISNTIVLERPWFATESVICM